MTGPDYQVLFGHKGTPPRILDTFSPRKKGAGGILKRYIPALAVLLGHLNKPVKTGLVMNSHISQHLPVNLNIGFF